MAQPRAKGTGSEREWSFGWEDNIRKPPRAVCCKTKPPNNGGKTHCIRCLTGCPNDEDSSDFIGFSLVTAIFAYFGEINLKGLSAKARRMVLLNGLLGGVLGYAWLLVHLRQENRRMHHLLVANAMVLAGILCGSCNERRRLSRTRRR